MPKNKFDDLEYVFAELSKQNELFKDAIALYKTDKKTLYETYTKHKKTLSQFQNALLTRYATELDINEKEKLSQDLTKKVMSDQDTEEDAKKAKQIKDGLVKYKAAKSTVLNNIDKAIREHKLTGCFKDTTFGEILFNAYRLDLSLNDLAVISSKSEQTKTKGPTYSSATSFYETLEKTAKLYGTNAKTLAKTCASLKMTLSEFKAEMSLATRENLNEASVKNIKYKRKTKNGETLETELWKESKEKTIFGLCINMNKPKENESLSTSAEKLTLSPKQVAEYIEAASEMHIQISFDYATKPALEKSINKKEKQAEIKKPEKIEAQKKQKELKTAKKKEKKAFDTSMNKIIASKDIKENLTEYVMHIKEEKKNNYIDAQLANRSQNPKTENKKDAEENLKKSIKEYINDESKANNILNVLQTKIEKNTHKMKFEDLVGKEEKIAKNVLKSLAPKKTTYEHVKNLLKAIDQATPSFFSYPSDLRSISNDRKKKSHSGKSQPKK